MNKKWYKNQSIWATLIASCALILSQLSPVSQWIPDTELAIRHGVRFTINNAIGIIGYNLVLQFENKGNTDINVYAVELRQTNPSGVKKTFPADSYIRTSDGVSVALTSIILSPGEIWSETVFFHKTPSPNIDEKYNHIKLKISQSIFDTRQQTPPEQFQSPQSPKADEKYVNEALQFFESNFDLEKGEYAVEIAAYVEGEKEAFIIRSEFTIFEYHIQTIRAQTDDYKYGAGIHFPSQYAKVARVNIEPNK